MLRKVKGKIEGIEEEDLRRMYDVECMSLEAIASKYGVSIATIWSRFNEYCIRRGTLSEVHRKYAINEDFFKTWGKEQAWLYGWALGDGNFTDPTSFNFKLQQGDKEVLSKFRKILESEHPIYDITIVDKRNNKEYYQSHIDFTSMKLVADLQKLDYSGIPDEYISDFIRGFFEAEGSWNRDRNRVQFGLSFAQKDRTILDWIWGKLKENHITETGGMHEEKNNMWCLKFGLHDAIKLYHYMYDSCGDLYLKRKKDRFPELVARWQQGREDYKRKWREKSWLCPYMERLEQGTITADEIWMAENKMREVPLKRFSVLRRINAMGYKTPYPQDREIGVIRTTW